MQIRMNISKLEEWARDHNRQAEHYENGSMTSSGEMTLDASRRHLAPVVQLLQWLQCFSSLKQEDLEGLVSTLMQLTRLTPQQLIHAVKHYRPEVGEKGLPKSAMKYLLQQQSEIALRRKRQRDSLRVASLSHDSMPSTPDKSVQGESERPSEPDAQPRQADTTTYAHHDPGPDDDHDGAPEHLLLDPALMLPFILPTSTDMLISYGAGFGGINRDRERKYIPSVPPEFLAKLDTTGERERSVYGTANWELED